MYIDLDIGVGTLRYTLPSRHIHRGTRIGYQSMGINRFAEVSLHFNAIHIGFLANIHI